MLNSKGYIIAKDFIVGEHYSGLTFQDAYLRTKKQLENLLKACETEQAHSAASFETKYIERLEALNDKLLKRLEINEEDI